MQLNNMEIDDRDWEPEHLWYTIGLITADGWLSSDGKRLSIVAKDKRFLEDILLAMKFNTSPKPKWQGKD
jgi:hypothetical protein